MGCTTGCPYCYARKQAKRAGKRCSDCSRFYPHSHADRLKSLYCVKKPKTWFLDSMWDFCCIHNPIDPLNDLTKAMRDNPRHRYILLTKQPQNMTKLYQAGDIPINTWIGVTITKQEDVWRLASLLVEARMLGFENLFISFEPLHGEIDIELYGVKWIIIGQETGRRKDKIKTQPMWAEALILQAEKGNINVFVKNNLIEQLPIAFGLKQVPWLVR